MDRRKFVAGSSAAAAALAYTAIAAQAQVSPPAAAKAPAKASAKAPAKPAAKAPAKPAAKAPAKSAAKAPAAKAPAKAPAKPAAKPAKRPAVMTGAAIPVLRWPPDEDRVEAIFKRLSGVMPEPKTELDFSNPFTLVVAVALVLCAVFVPCAFVSGITGQFFRQFAITIAVSTLISAFNSLTLSPALAALLFKAQAIDQEWLIRLLRAPNRNNLIAALRTRQKKQAKVAAQRMQMGLPPEGGAEASLVRLRAALRRLSMRGANLESPKAPSVWERAWWRSLARAGWARLR